MITHVCDSCGKTMVKYAVWNCSTGDKLHMCEECTKKILNRKSELEVAVSAEMRSKPNSEVFEKTHEAMNIARADLSAQIRQEVSNLMEEWGKEYPSNNENN